MFINGKRFLKLNIKFFSLDKLGLISLLFVSYSGYIKWIPGLFIDPFYLFFILLLVSIIFSGFKNTINKKSLKIIILVLLFFLWAFLSVLWGTSEVYYQQKISKSFVVIFCFVSPFFVLRTNNNVLNFIKLFRILTIVTAISFIFLYFLFDNFFVIFYGDDGLNNNGVPDYLALGILLSSGLLLSINKSGILWSAKKAIYFIAILLLAARGPLVSIVIILFFGFFWNRTNKVNFKTIVYFIVILAGLLYFGNGLLSRLNQRLEGISDNNSNNFSSIGTRFSLFEKGFDYFISSPIVGIGYGSFGKEITGFEDRIVPHNIFIEIGSELGFIGLFFFVFLMIYVYLYVKFKWKKNDDISSSLVTLIIFLILQSISTTYLSDSKALFLWVSILICYINISSRTIET
jgi:O-antigen ligase